MSENYELMEEIVAADISTLRSKGESYGGSWRRRGGAGAFMMLARKWDRIENIVGRHGYDIFAALQADDGGISDDIADLRCYLLLVEAHVLALGEAGPGYVDQG
jgi:hypothetical protein